MENKEFFERESQKVLKRFEDRKEAYEKTLTLLNSIKRVKTKEGKNYQILTKNFKSNLINKRYYDNLFEEYKIYFEGQIIYLKTTTTNEEYIKEIEKTNPERILKRPYLKDKLIYNVDEFEKEIEESKKRNEKRLQETIQEIKKFKENKEKIKEIYLKSYETLNNLKGDYYYYKDLLKIMIDNYYKPY